MAHPVAIELLMIVVVHWLDIGLRHHINFGASRAKGRVDVTTNMQVKRLRLRARRAPCPEPWYSAQVTRDASASSTARIVPRSNARHRRLPWPAS